MEHLFSTTLSIDQQSVAYEVVFDHELYNFEAQDQSAPSFSFRREHDEWYEQSSLSPELKQQAIDALEKYLLRQH